MLPISPNLQRAERQMTKTSISISINSNISNVGYVDRKFTDQEIKNEPMLFNNNGGSAYEQGGPITRAFLSELPRSWTMSPLVIDSRVHMLMPGWFPCIPGWHHDDVPRVRVDGQPEYVKPTIRAEHIMMLVNSHLAPTQFAIGKANFVEPPLGSTIYEQWHHDVGFKIQVGDLVTCNIQDRVLTQFDDRTWHRGVAATGNGWRFFIRASRYFDLDGQLIPRPGVRANEVRKQVQIYMSAENAGW